MSEQGIDITKSGWENPEGFKPRERDYVPPAPPACEAEGPNGWTCDLAKGHPGNAHHADTGPTWPMAGTLQGPYTPPEPARMAMDVTMPEMYADLQPGDSLALDVHTIAQAALADPAPANWALALSQIMEMTRGY